MGKAIILNDINFVNNIGTIVFVQNIPLVSLSIVGEDTISADETEATYSVGFTPSNTNQRGITWTLLSGSDIATITPNGTSCKVTVASTRTASSITIQAQSVENGTILTTKTIDVEAREGSFWDGIELVTGYWTTSGNIDNTSSNAISFKTWTPMSDYANYRITPASGVSVRVVALNSDGNYVRSTEKTSAFTLAGFTTLGTIVKWALNMKKSGGISGVTDPSTLATVELVS